LFPEAEFPVFKLFISRLLLNEVMKREVFLLQNILEDSMQPETACLGRANLEYVHEMLFPNKLKKIFEKKEIKVGFSP